MYKKKKKYTDDPRQPGLFDGPDEYAYGELSIADEAPKWLARAIRRSGKDRAEIAEEMSRLCGEPVSIHQINAWTAQSRQLHNFPLKYLPAFLVATGDFEVAQNTAEAAGCEWLVGRERAMAEITRRQLLIRRKQAEIERLEALVESE